MRLHCMFSEATAPSVLLDVGVWEDWRGNCGGGRTMECVRRAGRRRRRRSRRSETEWSGYVGCMSCDTKV